MLVDVIRHQHEKLGNAVRMLMSLTAPAPARMARAMRELALAFGNERPPEWAAPQMAAIRATVGDAVDVESRVQALDAPALEKLAAAFFELYTVACREYWTA